MDRIQNVVTTWYPFRMWWNPDVRHEPKELLNFPYIGMYEATIETTGVELPIVWIRERMLSDDIDVIALVANLTNMLAKLDWYWTEFWYQQKALLLEVILALDTEYPHQGMGYDDETGILYIETPVGQVSFHVVEPAVDVAYSEGGIVRRGYEWSGIPIQFEAPWLLLEIYEQEQLESS
jgi:hypothetical protein